MSTTVETFNDYLLETYIEKYMEPTLFLPNIWIEFAAAINHITNSRKSFHIKLNASLNAAHLNIFV